MRWDTQDGDDLLEYNALDTCATARVFREIVREPDWLSPRCQQLYRVHKDMSLIGAEMHSTGFLRHEQNARKVTKQLRMLATRRHNELIAHVGPRRSPAFRGTDNDMRALLYERHAKPGIRCYQMPEPATWDNVMWTNDQCHTLAVDKEALLRIFINHETPEDARDAIQLFWRAKAPGKALGTWVMGAEVLSKVGADGRMRADWNSAGTETMRWTSELMTLPQEKDDESLGGRLPNIRSIYAAAPGYVLYHWDWRQQELRMLQAISGDKFLAQALATGDVYSADARAWFPEQLKRLFGKEWETVSLKKEWANGRRQCKVGHLAAQYMAGAPAMWTQGLIQDRTIKFSAMKGIRALFHKVYWETVKYAEDEHKAVMARGYSEGRLLQGRRYYPPGPDGGVVAPITETCNYPVQRTAGEMGALTMVGIWKDLKKYHLDARILTNEHDAMTIEVKDNRETRENVREICAVRATGPWRIGDRSVEFPVDGHWGYDWAEACAD